MTQNTIEWRQLPFQYSQTDFRFVATHRDGEWDEGALKTDANVVMHEGSPVLHYCQTCFEGLKAYRTPSGEVTLFRPELNAQRLRQSATRLLMPEVSDALFLRGVEQVVRANDKWVPPHGTGASFYLRPYLMGVGENLGIRPAQEFTFRIFGCPVGPYYGKNLNRMIRLAVLNIDRAAPRGTGNVKAGANYAGGLLATARAKELGADEVLYLDSVHQQYLEEAGSANIVVLLKNGTFATPHSNTILSSVTRRSLMELAQSNLGLAVEERAIDLQEEWEDILEMGACGTAAGLTPVSHVWFQDDWHCVGEKKTAKGSVMPLLRDLLFGIQTGKLQAPNQWIYSIR